jgi:hypothetical protein
MPLEQLATRLRAHVEAFAPTPRPPDDSSRTGW